MEEDFNREFGDEITVACFSLCGELNTFRAESLASDIVLAIGMTCSHGAHTTLYPLDPVTGVSPGFIVQQCIIESFVTLDVWPPRKGVYIHVASCKDFDPSALDVVFRRYDLRKRSIMGGYLSL